MYAVVGCTDCAALWLVSDPEASKTTRCPRCGRRHRIQKLRRFFESPSEDEARQARSELLAKKQGASAAFADLDSVAELGRRADEPAVDDREYLEASGIDADAVEAAGDERANSRSRDQVVRDAIGDQDRPTEADIVDYATEHGVPADAARDLLEELTRRGDASESGGRYRLL